MSAIEMLEQSHMLVMRTIEDIPEGEWDVPGVCGNWSVKDVLAHLTSYEHLLVDALTTFSGSEPTPYLRKFLADMQAFNASEVSERKYWPSQQVENEYNDLQLQSSDLLAKLSPTDLEKPVKMLWTDTDRSVTDFVHIIHTHTQEHCAQIAAFRKQAQLP